MSLVVSHDSQAIALLCAPIAIGDAKPLTPSEWANLRPSIHASSLERPGALVGLTSSELRSRLGLAADMADRLAGLLDRGGTLAFELERLESRGVWMVTRPDDGYPESLQRHLGARAPALLFGAGRRDVVPGRGVAVVGSRDAGDAALEFAADLGRSIARGDATVVSGAARGIDQAAMGGALEAGGSAAGVVADSLVRLTQRPDIRAALADESLSLVTPYAPEARFSVGNAMGRNRLIYCLSDVAVVVATSAGSGGTWAGAVENLKAKWVPLRVWSSSEAPNGNRELEGLGAVPVDSSSVDVLFDSAVHDAVAGDGAGTDARGLGDASDGDAGVLQALERFLTAWRTEAEVVAELGLGRGPARALLKRGVESGRYVREGKPFRYIAVETQAQASLFDGT